MATKRPTKKEMITRLTTTISQSEFLLATSDETRRNAQFSEGEWIARVEGFLKDPTTNVPNTPMGREIATALLTQSYASHLSSGLVRRLTKVLHSDSMEVVPKRLTAQEKKKVFEKLRGKIAAK